MKRRDFIINSAVTLGGTVLLSGCANKELIQSSANNIQSQGEINCVLCKHCIEVCPKNINIPEIFSLYNQYKATNNKMSFKTDYETLSENERADKCVKCNLCSRSCPQSLDIPTLLSKIDDEYKRDKSGTSTLQSCKSASLTCRRRLI